MLTDYWLSRDKFSFVEMSDRTLYWKIKLPGRVYLRIKGIDDKESGYDDSQERRELEKAAEKLFG